MFWQLINQLDVIYVNELSCMTCWHSKSYDMLSFQIINIFIS